MNAINKNEVSMFKTGEQVVMTDADDYNSIFTVVGKPFRMYQLKGPDDLFYGRLDIQIRHATSEEVAAGHRITHSVNVNDMGYNTHIENHVSPNCKKFEEQVGNNETK